jgi:hypothetical protein
MSDVFSSWGYKNAQWSPQATAVAGLSLVGLLPKTFYRLFIRGDPIVPNALQMTFNADGGANYNYSHHFHGDNAGAEEIHNMVAGANFIALTPAAETIEYFMAEIVFSTQIFGNNVVMGFAHVTSYKDVDEWWLSEVGFRYQGANLSSVEVFDSGGGDINVHYVLQNIPLIGSV